MIAATEITPAYRLMTISFLSVGGFSILKVAAPLAVLEVNASETALAIVQSAAFVSPILLGSVIGILNDRINKGTAIRFFITLQISVLTVAAVFWWQRGADVWLLALLMLTIGAGQYCFANARIAFVKVGFPPERYASVNAGLSTAERLGVVLGPLSAGAIMGSIGFQAGIAVCAALLLLALLFSRHLRVDDQEAAIVSVAASFREGLAEFLQNRAFLAMAIVVFFTNAFQGAYEVALLLKIHSISDSHEWLVGIVFAAMACGAVIGNAMVAPLRSRLGNRATFGAPLLCNAMLFAIPAGTDQTIPLVVSSVLLGVSSAVFLVGMWTFRQETTSARAIARVAGLSGAFFKLGVPFAMVASGFVSERLAPSYVFLSISGASAALFITWSLYRLDR